MTLRRFLKQLNDLVDANPSFEELQVVSASDDEGNAFNEVIYEPALGNFEDDEFENTDIEPNAICIN